MTSKNFKVYGYNACLAFSKNRPDQVIRAYFTKNVAKSFKDLQLHLAKVKKIYRLVSEEDLQKISQSQHHEGVCFVVESPRLLTADDWLKAQKEDSLLLVLEGVSNPHNMGAIMRICAHFGVSAIASENPKAFFSGAAMRVAEGGGEYVYPIGYRDIEDFLKKLRSKKYQIVTTSSHNGKSLYKTKLPKRVAIVFGAEGEGITKKAFSQEDLRIKIPGTSNVESLNVSTSVSLLLGEWWRQSTIKEMDVKNV